MTTPVEVAQRQEQKRKAEESERLTAQWQELKGLLGQAQKLDAKQEGRLAELMEALELSAADVQLLAEVVERQKTLVDQIADRERIERERREADESTEQLWGEINKLRRKIDAWEAFKVEHDCELTRIRAAEDDIERLRHFYPRLVAGVDHYDVPAPLRSPDPMTNRKRELGLLETGDHASNPKA